MSRTPNIDENRALARISQSADGKILLALLNDRLAEYDRTSRRLTGEQLLICNGKRLEIESTLDMINHAMTNARAGENR